jgi:hypothetical protein
MANSPHSRYLAISGIADEIIKEPIYENKAKIDHERIEIALDKYWRHLPILKNVYGIDEKLDRHKVAACTSIFLFREKPIIVNDTKHTNGFLKIINQIFAIHAGYSNIGNSLLIPDEVVAAIISQFDLNEYSYLSLSAQYYLIEKLIENHSK